MQINPVALLSKARTMKSTGTSRDHCTTTQRNIAFITNEERWTDERLASEVNRLATGLVERGVQRGDRVALHMANLPEFVIAYQACFKVGAIAAPLNLRLKAAELSSLLQRLRPALYIGQAALYSQVASIDSSILATNRRFVVGGAVNDPLAQPWMNLLADASREPIQWALDMHAPAVLMTTSAPPASPNSLFILWRRYPKLPSYLSTLIWIATRSPRWPARWYTPADFSPCSPVCDWVCRSSYLIVLILTSH
jgi:acyl-CoA synthetase (AMP-forming)/AMP-acid ligase II